MGLPGTTGITLIRDLRILHLNFDEDLTSCPDNSDLVKIMKRLFDDKRCDPKSRLTGVPVDGLCWPQEDCHRISLQRFSRLRTIHFISDNHAHVENDEAWPSL